MYEEAIDKAIDRLENEGWERHVLRSYNGYCAIGAILGNEGIDRYTLSSYNLNLCAFLDKEYPGLFNALTVATTEFVGADRDIMTFNDIDATSKDDVIQVLEKVRAKEDII